MSLESKLGFIEKVKGTGRRVLYTGLALLMLASSACYANISKPEPKFEDLVRTEKTEFKTEKIKPKVEKLQVKVHPIELKEISPDSLRTEYKVDNIPILVFEYSYLNPDYRLMSIIIGNNPKKSFSAYGISPDGSKIIGCISEEAGKDNHNVCKVDLEKKVAVEILNKGKDNIDPSMSDDGMKIAFNSVKVDSVIKEGYIFETSLGSQEIMLADLVSGSITTLTKSDYKMEIPIAEPAHAEATSTGKILLHIETPMICPLPIGYPEDCAIVSGQGNKVAIETKKTGNKEVYVFDTESRVLTNISNHRTIDELLGISSDGNKVLFRSYREHRRIPSYNHTNKIFLADTKRKELTKFLPSFKERYFGYITRDGNRVLVGNSGTLSFDLTNNKLTDMTELLPNSIDWGILRSISINGNLVLYSRGSLEFYREYNEVPTDDLCMYNEYTKNSIKLMSLVGGDEFSMCGSSDDGRRIIFKRSSNLLERK